MEIRTIPEIPFIGEGAEKLYALEDTRNKAIKAAAQELADVLGHTKEEYWTKTIPEALANVLESYERAASVAAAIGYLRQYGNVTVEFEDGAKLTVGQRKAGRKAGAS